MQLADTNVISELMRRQPNAGVLGWRDGKVVVAAQASGEATGGAGEPAPLGDLGLGTQSDLHAAVLRAAVLAAVVGDGFVLAVALRAQPCRVDAQPHQRAEHAARCGERRGARAARGQ